jgi:hypothetical protein
VWTYNYDNAFFQAGGNLAMQFTLSSAYTRYGCWGLTEDITDPERNVKYRAAKLLAEKYPAKVFPVTKGNGTRRFSALAVSTIGERIRIAYSLRAPADVVITARNSKGQLLKRTVFPRQTAGRHIVTWNDAGGASTDQFLIVAITTGMETRRCGCIVLH